MIFRLLLSVAVLVSLSAPAAEIEGYKFEDTITVDGKELLLNGVGLRTVKRYGMKFKVYVAGLYVEKRSTDAKSFLDGSQMVHIKSYYLREVTKKQQRDPFRDAVRKNCFADCKGSKKKILQIIKAVKRTKKGGAFDFTMYPEKTHFSMDGANAKSETTIDGAEFSKDMVAIWLGAKPPNKSLKAGMLGKGMDWAQDKK